MKFNKCLLAFMMAFVMMFFASGLIYAEEPSETQTTETTTQTTEVQDPNTTETSETTTGTTTSQETEVEVKKGWVEEDGKRYYYKNGEKVTGLKTISKKVYYFDEDGVMQTGFVTIDDNRYYFNSKGRAVNGLKKISGKYYYFVDYMAVTGFQTIDDNLYYFNLKSYKAVTGLKTIDGEIYDFNSKGVAQKGWQTIKKKKYYFDKTSKQAYKGLKKIGKALYYFNDKGVMQKGWKTINKKRYYFQSNGKAATSTITIKKKKYYFNADGTQKTVLSAEDKMDQVAQSLSSSTKYLILVNTSTHRVGIYTGSKNNWKRIKYVKCGNGKASTPTIKGVFKTGTTSGRYHKALYFDTDGGARCWYATRIVRGYLFHSVLYYRSGSPSKIKDGRLGVGVSHGCIRLDINDAKWIYNNIPRKTTVKMY